MLVVGSAGSAGLGAPGRTPPRGGRPGTSSGTPPGGSAAAGPGEFGGPRAPSPLRGGRLSPMRGARPGGGEAPLPGSLPDEEEPMMIHSGASTPLRGSSKQGPRGSSQGGLRASASSRARNPSTPGGGGKALDDAEEQLIEYILNDEARAAA